MFPLCVSSSLAGRRRAREVKADGRCEGRKRKWGIKVTKRRKKNAVRVQIRRTKEATPKIFKDICPQFYFLIQIIEIKQVKTHKKRIVYEGNLVMIITDPTDNFSLEIC